VGFSTRVVIPAFDAGEAVAAVVRSVRDLGWDDVVVIDDGSRDGTGDFAREAGARVVVHPVNRG
jgi:glycosyltransferase involved in cell wall biosynthesis